MRRNKKREFVGSEAELVRMTQELDEMHNDLGMPAMWEGVERVIEATRREEFLTRASSRRTFILGASAVAVGGTALLSGGLPSIAGAVTRARAGTSSFGSASSSASVDHVFPPSNLTGDLAVAAVAASLENLAIFAYTAGLGAATAGKLGKVPPAVATFATTARTQHTQHSTAWNAVLKANGKARVTVTNPSLTPTVKADFAKVKTIPDLANLALVLEIIAAETYQAETAMLKSKEAIGLSASIQPVEMQHIAILYYVLGEYPGTQNAAGSPLAFAPTSKAV
ncbi:MAG: ferritin-like domain-containing protein [Acidimicrobiales bacterium]